MFHRSLTFLVVLALAAIAVPAALAVRVHVRVEGKTQTIFGATEPRLTVTPTTIGDPPGTGAQGLENPLDALEAASQASEFYYHVTQSSFGAYVDQIGRYAGGASSGWLFKINGELPPIGAHAVELEEGARVLWYYATFGPTGGPPTLELKRAAKRGCYRAVARDDNGGARPASGAVLRVDGRSIPTRAGRGCVGRHRGLVRATAPGAVRSNALR